MRTICYLSFFLLFPVVLGWWDTGHMLVSTIAQMQVQQDVVDKMNDILSDWEDNFPGQSDATTAATWPDWVRCGKEFCPRAIPDGINTFNDWHHGDEPYNPDSLPLSKVQTDLWASNPSISWVLQQTVQTFTVSKTRFACNLYLRFATHFVGDVHMPLHAISGYFNDTTFGNLTNGDQNAGLIRIKTNWLGVTNLHALWDAAGGLYLDRWPFSDASKKNLIHNATLLTQKYPKDSPLFVGRYNATELDSCWNSDDFCKQVFIKWCHESYNISVQSVYPGASQDAVLSEQYIENARNISQIQIVLAGYRLGDFLRLAYPTLKSLPERKQSNEKSSDWEINNAGKLFIGIGGFLFVLVIVLVITLVRSKRTTDSNKISLLQDQ